MISSESRCPDSSKSGWTNCLGQDHRRWRLTVEPPAKGSRSEPIMKKKHVLQSLSLQATRTAFDMLSREFAALAAVIDARRPNREGSWRCHT